METIPNTVQAEPARQLYDPTEAARIVRHLTDGYFSPEYILLFGKLAGGTPHSEVPAYDLLVVMRETPPYDWFQAKRMLRYQLPPRLRKICYVNLYIETLQGADTAPTPFLYLARSEGELLHCNRHYRFSRPRRPCNFAKAYADARFHSDTFRRLGDDLLEQAQEAFAKSRFRLAALCAAQAAVHLYHTLYYVYHGREFEYRDPVIMHDRMRTLSAKLMLAFDDNHIENIFTLPRLKEVLTKGVYEPEFRLSPQEVELHLDRVRRAAGIIGNTIRSRLELYGKRCG